MVTYLRESCQRSPGHRLLLRALVSRVGVVFASALALIFETAMEAPAAVATLPDYANAQSFMHACRLQQAGASERWLRSCCPSPVRIPHFRDRQS